MQNDKKTEVIAIRTTKKTKDTLEKIAAEHEWTVSKLAEKIISNWANEQREEE